MKFKGNRSLTLKIPLNIKVLPLLRSIANIGATHNKRSHKMLNMPTNFNFYFTEYSHNRSTGRFEGKTQNRKRKEEY